MSKISHMVVTYNHDTRELDYDVETTLAKFPDGVIFNEEAGEWQWAENSTDEGNDLDAIDLLANIFMKFNEGG